MRDVAEALKEANHEVPKSAIILSTVIKTTGEYPVRLTLHAEVIATIKLTIAKIESEAA